ncbi:cytochrome c-type biogenesis protein [Alsobacter sp. R-9]
MHGRFARALRAALAAALLVAAVAPAARAVQPGEVLADPKLEGRARALSTELRCLVCQNQSIDDSDAPLARDLRLIVREKLKEGASDAEIRDFLVARYGEFVLLKPPFGWHTALLWLAPFAVLAAGAAALIARARRPSAVVTEAAPLTEEERAEVERMLGKG